MDVEHSAGAFATTSAMDKGKKPEAASLDEERSIGHGENDLLGGEKVDRALAAKMVLINDVSPEEKAPNKTRSPFWYNVEWG